VAGTSVSSTVPAQIETVSGREINAWRPRVLPDVLARQAGVSFYDDLGTPWKLNLSSRGFTAGPTVGLPPGLTVFLDGVRQNEPDAQEVNFDLLPAENIERVELLNGTASLHGPNSLGGAINLVSARGHGPMSGMVQTSAGSFGMYDANVHASGQASNGWSYYGNGGVGTEKGWREATSDHSYNGFVNVGKELSDRGIRLQAYASRSRAETAGSLPETIFRTSPQVNFTPGDFEDLDAQQLSLTAHSPIGVGHLNLTLYGRHSDAERFNVNQFPDPNVRGITKNYTAGGTADWRWTSIAGPGALALRLGADAAANSVRVQIFNEAQTAPTNPEADDDDDNAARGLTTDVRSPSWDAAGYALADYRIGRVTFSGGARTDYVHVPFHNLLNTVDNTATSYSHISPRGGVSVDLGHAVLVYGSIGDSFRAPAILELGCADPEAACPLPFALGDDPPLKPVSARTYEAGARWSARTVSLSGSVYRTDVRNEIFFVASEDALLSGYFTNLARTRRIGGEMSLQGDALHERVDWFASYAYTHATFASSAQIFSIRSDDDFDGNVLAGANAVVSGNKIPLVPAHQAKAGASLRLSRMLSAGLDGRYIGRQWLRGDEANETTPLAPYAILNARMGVSLRGWDISGVVINAFDTHRAIFGTFNENRRTGDLERFLTPMTARTVRLVIGRSFGASRADSSQS
jgi:outer membrane receptor protein involved in Fe transport